MHYERKIEIYKQNKETVKSNLATFFLFNNFKVEFYGEDQMRVENLYPRFDLKRPPSAEIKSADFKWYSIGDTVMVEVDAAMHNPRKMLKKRKKIIYTAMAALIISDMIYTASAFFWRDFSSWLNINNLLLLLFIPLVYLILHYHFFKAYKSRHHNDLDRLLENLQFSKMYE